jgi:hypothetical protein
MISKKDTKHDLYYGLKAACRGKLTAQLCNDLTLRLPNSTDIHTLMFPASTGYKKFTKCHNT